MNILFLSTWFPYPPDNGSKIRAFYLLRALAERYAVTALAFQPSPDDRQTADYLARNRTPVIAVFDDPFRHVHVPRWKRYLSPSPLAFRASLAMRGAVREASARGPWDAVVAVQMPVAQYALQASARAWIVDVDTALAHQLRERFVAQQQPIPRASAWVSWQKARRYEGWMLRHFQAATVASPLEVAPLQQMAGRRPMSVAVIPNGVDCHHNRLDLAQPRPATLVYNGSLTYSANYEAMQWFLADIWPRIRAQVPNATLAITGSTNGVDLAELALDDHVRLLDYIDDVRIPVAEAAVAIAPIRQGGGTRLKILEAMALGTPVVATTKGAEGLDVASEGHLLLADDAERFAAAVLRLLVDEVLAARLCRNARQLVEQRYDWDAIGGRFVALVEETVIRQSVPASASA